MLIGRFLLILIMLWTFIFDANTIENRYDKSKLIILPIQSVSSSSSDYQIDECQEACSVEYCLSHVLLNKNCKKLIRDQCDCCTVCVRNENEVCGGKFNVHGICEQDLLCYQSNKTKTNEKTGICVKACLKYQCLSVMKKDKTICECANRRVPCDNNLLYDTKNNCDSHSLITKEYESRFLKAPVNQLINCSNVICEKPLTNASICPLDSHFVEDHTPLLRASYSLTKNLTSICCQPQGHCACSPCVKTLCGENSIIQIYRTGNPNLPGQCCDQYDCIKNPKQCIHDRKAYKENETWSIDHCTTCTCRNGRADCAMIQCPTYTHCGYMYKPENECCPICGGCLNDRFHIQHMNSTWIESNGCMRCWCENGRSRCVAEGCIAPPCDNPRQIENVCCPVCDDDDSSFNDNYNSRIINSIIESASQTSIQKCLPLDDCLLTCEHGLAKDEFGCFQCACLTMSCPTPLCTLKFDKSSKQYCSCLPPPGTNCAPLYCDKHCPYNYAIDKDTGCPYCACNPCPPLVCTKKCTYGLKKNDVGCSICVCESNFTSNNALVSQSWPRQCQSGSSSYSNGEIWFDGCRQCLCHRGEQLCALISCPPPKCSHPILLPNRCCPSCPDTSMLPEPIPSSQVCYASQYVTGEELEFDKCTKCICLHNIAFCSMSLCPPLPCSSPIYDSSLCCPICPRTSESVTDVGDLNEDFCLLDNGMIKNAGEIWKNNDCQSCLCPRDNNGQIKCFSQTCSQQLPCTNPVLKKGQCCPSCLPATAAVAVCIFNYVQYRSGEHWNVSECHHCECSLGTIVCHQYKCPTLTCVHTVTLPGHCCPICRDQLPFIRDPDKLPMPPSSFSRSIIIIFSFLIFILVLVIIILFLFLLRGGRRSLTSPNQISTTNHRSPILSQNSTASNSKLSNTYSYKYNLMLISNEMSNPNAILSSSSNIPLTSIERTSMHSIIGTNTTGTNSSNNENEPSTWNEDDTLMLHCSTSSNDDDYEHEIISDYDESQQQQQQQQQQQPSSPRSQIQMITGRPTIIYV